MEHLYLPIKHSHWLFVILSIVLLNLRFGLRLLRPQDQLPKLLRILPHINDTLLVLLGLMLMHIVRWNPVGNAKWLGVKLVFLVVYIIFGAKALRSQPRSGAAWLYYALAMLFVLIMMYLARFKPF